MTSTWRAIDSVRPSDPDREQNIYPTGDACPNLSYFTGAIATVEIRHLSALELETAHAAR